MNEKPLFDVIHEALSEAVYWEWSHSKFDQERVILNAMRLSGAPYSFTKDVFTRAFQGALRDCLAASQRPVDTGERIMHS